MHRMKAKVAVIKTTPERVLADIGELCRLADMPAALAKSQPVILKDNISWHLPFLSANTTPWQLEGVIRALKASGWDRLVAVHNNTVVTDPDKGLKLNRLLGVYRKYGVEEKYNFNKEEICWVPYHPKFKTRALHKVYGHDVMVPEYFFGKNIVHLPTVKTHIYTTTTGAMKNAFGGLLGTHRHYTHSWIHEVLVDLLKIQQDIHSGIFCVMDGTICGCGPGPRTMVPVEKGYMLASSDSVAIDAVAAKMMGFEPLAIPYIRMAHEDGIGTGDVRDIEIAGEDVRGVNFHFYVGQNMVSRFGRTVWFGPLKSLQKFFFRTPLVYFFVYASFFYHDYIWWPLIGKRRQRKIAATAWGRLFESYPR
ncbi:MAG: DUF362 domain-containing protein [Candidatus Omnitrophota bacterium]